MQQTKHIVIVAGEESGDHHAANFVKQLKQTYPQLSFSGIGGHHMEKAGVHLIADLARYAVTGGLEIIRHIFLFKKAFQKIKAHLQETRPDLLILVDYPGFNLRLAKYAKEVLNIRILYYIGPQIWGWKPNRIHTIRRCIDKMAVILPFEKTLYQKAGVPVAFVGHPLLERMTLSASVADTKNRLGIPNDKMILALLPGSRRNEIQQLLPIYHGLVLNLVKKYSNLHIVIPIARTLTKHDLLKYFDPGQLPITFIDQHAAETIYCSDFVVVASGTASFECALLMKPMCIVYKIKALTYIIAWQLMRIKYLGLCNVLANKMIVPELLQRDCSVPELTRTMQDLIDDPEKSQRMIVRLRKLKQSLSQQEADISLPDLIIQELGL